MRHRSRKADETEKCNNHATCCTCNIDQHLAVRRSQRCKNSRHFQPCKNRTTGRCRVRPNPSFEARPNGKPPGPGRWYAYIFTGPGLTSYRWYRLNSNVRRHLHPRPYLAVRRTPKDIDTSHMSSTTLRVLLVLGFAYAAFAVPTALHFNSYCEQVAKATGRTKENQDIWHRDDGGFNKFQRELLRKLRTGEYRLLPDPALVAQGAELARKLRLSFWLGVGLVVTVAVTDMWTK